MGGTKFLSQPPWTVAAGSNGSGRDGAEINEAHAHTLYILQQLAQLVLVRNPFGCATSIVKKLDSCERQKH